MTTNGLVQKVKKLHHTFSVQHVSCKQMCNIVKCWQWDITHILDIEKRKNTKYAVLVLNRPVSQSQDFVMGFWNGAALRMTVDGGTTHWNKFLKNLSLEEQKMMQLPDMITGDFDSITTDLLQEYKKKGCKALHMPDQNDTDFTKALMELNNYCKQHETEMDHVIAIGQNSGRIDQILGNIQTLFLVRERELLNPNTKVYIMSDDTMSWLLSPGDHVIFVPVDSRNNKRSWCSLVPIGESCEFVTTSGLKWNLNNQPLKYGVLVSTSNTFDGSEFVKIKCSHTLLWSMKVPSLFC